MKPARVIDMAAPRTGPSINRHRSNQEIGTPREFLDACERRFGQIDFDLAASAKNAVVPHYFTKAQDSLAQDWTMKRGLLWLNPPFANITPWAEKCAETATPLTRILFLVPASVGSVWYARHVLPHAVVYGLRPRMKFVGSPDPYPKDLVLAVFGMGVTGFGSWKWKQGRHG